MNETASPPLADVRVLDLTDGFGAYAGRLLAGLGADVLRIRGVTEGSGPPLAPVAQTERGSVSLFDEWVDAGKQLIDIDGEDPENSIEALVRSSDVLLSGISGRRPGGWSEENPDLVHVVVSPFGWDLSPDWGPVDDLVVLGAGGLLHLGGYPDTGPVGAFGHQSLIASGIFGAVAVLVGLIERDRTGRGNSADVSAQEAIAQALEDSLPTYALTGVVRGPQGEDAREAGTGVYACSDGYVSMVAGRLGTARAWKSLVEWLADENDEAAELRDPEWSEFTYRQGNDANTRFREIFETVAKTMSKEELYVEGQRRGIAISPVSDIEDLLANRQLEARGFFVESEYPRLAKRIRIPGSPYRMSASRPVILNGMSAPGGTV